MLYPGMLKPGKSTFICLSGSDAREVIKAGREDNEEAYKMMGWKWNAKVIRGKKGGKRMAKKNKMRGDMDDDDDMMDSAYKLGASAAVALVAATLY